MIEMIPKPNFWRAPNDNDCGNLMPMRYAQWKIASMYLSHKYPTGGPTIRASKEPGNRSDEGVGHASHLLTACRRYRQASAGFPIRSMETERSRRHSLYDPVKELGDMPEFGVMFKLDADYNQVKWYGMGPSETYVDRCHGAKLGIYENTVAENMAHYRAPQVSAAIRSVSAGQLSQTAGDAACALRAMRWSFLLCRILRMRWKMRCIHLNFRVCTTRLCG